MNLLFTILPVVVGTAILVYFTYLLCTGEPEPLKPKFIYSNSRGVPAIKEIQWTGREKVACFTCGVVNIRENMYGVVQKFPFFPNTSYSSIFYCYDHRQEYDKVEHLWGKLDPIYYQFNEVDIKELLKK